MSYIVGSFNMHNLGKGAIMSTSRRNINLIANIIAGANMDIVALQEVLSDIALKANYIPEYERDVFKDGLIKELKSVTGSSWEFSWADATNIKDRDITVGESQGDMRGEGYAFVWNTDRIEPCKVYIDHKNNERDGTVRTFQPRMLAVNKEAMFRKPYYGRFKIKDMNVELRIICVHTYYCGDSPEGRRIRQHELDILLQDIYPQVEVKRYGNFTPSYTVMLGDYNAELWNSDSHKWQSVLKRKRQTELGDKIPAVMVTDIEGVVRSKRYGGHEVKTVQTDLTTLKKKKVQGEPETTAGFSYNYDHASYEPVDFDGVKILCKRFPDAVTKYCRLLSNEDYADEYEKYYKTVSDHVPIVFEMEFR